jgi:hypothetical protein
MVGVDHTHPMSKRLQVVMNDAEIKGYERAARAEGLGLSEWVRQKLRAARRSGPEADASKKLTAIRNAARHRFPAPDLDQMLAEIERGYHQGSQG